ncbi:DUF397 domain-containing protein [Actinomadura craniellae]|uniref:DUF397 domain-containing protein n=1 Tax=Actinomadura craniellae TaxID=2231787 RepID=A0A365H982_9ACTN|nr:DUF397 domain-containing protein [Actinomadura craniellae]RAY14823.1 DUF397 domain-containing protein [Actinomadura craniellae]
MGEDPRHLAWRRSSYSTSGENCVEVAAVIPDDYAAVRDSKDPEGPRLVLEGRAWRRLGHRIKAGAFDLGIEHG